MFKKVFLTLLLSTTLIFTSFSKDYGDITSKGIIKGEILTDGTLVITEGNLDTEGTLTSETFQINDSSSVISKDASGNIVFKDAVTGEKTLYELTAEATTDLSGHYGTELEDVSNAGSGIIISDAERTKLGTIEESANNYSLPTATGTILGGVKVGSLLSITTGVLSATLQTVNDFTNTLKNKLDGIAENAEVNINSDWDAVSGDAEISNKPSIPTALSDLSDDSTHRITTDAEKSIWNGKSDLALGETETTAYRGDRGKTAYDHSQAAHAPSNADNTAANETSHADVVVDGDFASNGILKRTSAGVYGITSDNSTDWDTGYSHSQTTIGNPHSLDYSDIGLSSNQVVNWTGESAGTIHSTNYVDNNTQLSEEEVEDFVGTMVTGGTETRINVTYTDGVEGAGILNFVVEDMYDNTDTQDLGVDGNNITLTNGGTADVSTTTAVTANTNKATNVTTNLTEGTSTTTTVDINSSDGSNATLVAASTSRAGLLTKAKFDEIVANTNKTTESTSVTTPITLDGVSVGIVNQGTTTQVLHGNAAGNAAFGAIVDNDVPDDITITEADPIVGAISGIIKADGAGNISQATDGVDYLSSEVDGSITNEINTITTPDAEATEGLDITFADTGIMTISEVGDTITFDATEVDGSITNELQDLDLTTNTLSLSDSVPTIDLSGYLDNTDTQLTQEQVEDYAGGLFTGNIETLITATYQVADNTVDLVVDNNLANYSNASSGFLTTEVDGSTTNELQDLFSTIAVATQDNIVVDTNTDTLTLVGAGITTITTTAGSDTITFTSTEADTLDTVSDRGSTTDQAITTGGVTIATGQNFTVGTTQWNSADELDGTRIKDADYGDVTISAGGYWDVYNAQTVTTNANLSGEVTSSGNAAVLDPTCISGKADTTIADADYVVFWDATDSTLKKVDAAELTAGGGASQLSDLSDVGVTTPTDKNALMADGDSWESRALVEADISDLGTYLTAETNNLETVCTGIATTEIYIGNAPNDGIYVALSGDVTMDNTGDVTVSTAAACTGESATVTTITGLAPDTATTQVAQGNITSATALPWTGLKPGTDGEIPTFDASGNPAFVAVGTATHVLTSNGVDTAPTFQAASGGGGGLAWEVISGADTAASGEGFLIDSSGGVVTLTLPGSPSEGDTVAVCDYTNSATTNAITVGRNSSNIESVAADLVIDVDGAGFTLVYSDATRGWVIVTEI